jgi:drug/metabolite transporter (DMT)-like permease
MIVSCTAFAIMWALIRLASADLHPFEIVFFRNIIGLAALSPMLLANRGLLQSARMPIHLRRATSGFLATLGTFYAIANAPLATVLAINYTAPLFATLGAVLLLGERIHGRRIAALLVGFAGMLIVLRPGAAPLTPGLAAAMLSAVATGLSIVAIRSLVGSDDPRAVTAWSFILMTPPSLAVALFVWRWPSLHAWPLLAAIGVAAAIGQSALSNAFASSEASAVLPYDFVRFGLITAFGIGLFGERYDIGTFIGGGVILGTTVYLAYREAVVGRRLARRLAESAAAP